MKTIMKKLLVVMVAFGLLIPQGASVHAQGAYETVRFPLMSQFDLDSASYTYCVTTGQGGRVLSQGRQGRARIKSTAASTTVTSFTASSAALDNLTAGDELEIISPSSFNGAEGPVINRLVTAVASDDSITVNSAVTLTDALGHGYTWRQRTCGTTAADGWFPTKGFGYLTVQFEIDQMNVTGGIDYKVDCRLAGSDSEGVSVAGPTNITAASTVGVRVQGPWDECRLGFKIGSADDGGDLTTNLEQLDGIVELRR